MNLVLDDLDRFTQSKYEEFQEKVEEVLRKYQVEYQDRYELIQKKIEQTNGNWDTNIQLTRGELLEHVAISQLLAFEYCLAAEKITKGKVSFEEMAEKLFGGVQKFRIGNPVKGVDDECLYGKSFDDETAIPVTSKLYRMVMNAGAQHLEYVKDGKMTGAVFIYEKGNMGEIAVDEHGNPVLDIATDGIDFKDLRKGQSLLNNLRQTAFHEWNHCSEKEILSITADTIPFEYECEDGKRYRNYDQITEYVTLEKNHDYQEPTYVISTEKDERGNRKKYYLNEEGTKKSFGQAVEKANFGLVKKQLDEPIYISSGLTTKEPNGKMHNIVTEGFVEYTARSMVMAIEEGTQDIEEGKYFEQVEMAKEVIAARDASMGKEGAGQTFADFLMHSSKLKRDLETRNVIKEDGSRTDGLHYIADYADRAKAQETEKWQFLSDKNMQNVCKNLGLLDAQEKIKPLGITETRKLSQEQKEKLEAILMSGTHPDKQLVDRVITEYSGILERENQFFEGIAKQLGYDDREVAQGTSTRLKQLDDTQEQLKYRVQKLKKLERTRGKDAFER